MSNGHEIAYPKDLAVEHLNNKLTQNDGEHSILNGFHSSSMRVGEKRTHEQRAGSSIDMIKDDFDKYSLKESNYEVNGQLKSSYQGLQQNGHKQSHNGDAAQMNGIDCFGLDEREHILEPKQKKLQLGFADYS